MLTVAVSRVAFPAQARQSVGNGFLLSVLVEPGTYAVDPEPSAPPWRSWREIGADEAAARGVFAPVHSVPCGEPGRIVVAPGDTRGVVLVPERFAGSCCGLDGGLGPNLECARCGRPVATRVDDCSQWQAVWFTPDAVRRGEPDRIVDWDALVLEGTPPVEPSGWWNFRWEAEVAVTLAHLLVASEGAPLAVPDGLVAATIGRTLDSLLPPGPKEKTVALVGPGLVPDPLPDICLVPLHPQTGEAWPSGSSQVALAADVWAHLAFHDERRQMPATGGLPDGVLRDDPLPRHPQDEFSPDGEVLLHTLARMPAVRQPWLRDIYDRVNKRPYSLPY